MTHKPRFRGVILVYKKDRYRIYVRSVPAVKHMLNVRLRDAAGTLHLRVFEVVYELAANGRTKSVELHCCRAGGRAAHADRLFPCFHREIKWPAGDCPPGIRDSVRLPRAEDANPLDLKVMKVTHEIDQVAKGHVVNVQVIDASPRRLISDEDIATALSDEIEPLVLPCDEEWRRDQSI